MNKTIIASLALANLIIAVGSVDGVCTAAAVARLNGNPVIEMVFCQAFTVDKLPVSTWAGRRIVLVDLAVNNRDVEMTRRFITALRDGDNQLVAVIDEHNRADWLEVMGSFEDLVVEPQSQTDADGPKSSGEVLRRALDASGEKIDQHTLQLLGDADAADRMDFSGPFASVVNQAMKSNIADDTRRVYLARHFATNTAPDAKIASWMGEYEEILANHKQIVDAKVDLGDGIMRVVATGKKVDMTTLMNSLYKAGAKVVVLEGEAFNKALGRKTLQISFGASDPKLNLLTAIQSIVPTASGFASKVNVDPEHEAAALAAVRELLQS